MRIICPNCAAEYEVDDLAIPVEGRDVQCSNCGHGWYQFPPALAAALEAGGRAQDGERASPPGEDGTDEGGAREERDTGAGPGEDAPEGGPSASRRSLDSAVRDVLRSEAQREVQARRAEAGLLESQPELGLAAPARRAGPPPPPAAAGQRPHAAVEAAQDEASRPVRRKQLPDIADIDPGLPGPTRGASSAASGAFAEDVLTDAPDDEASRRRGFRMGFLGVVLIAVLAIALYAVARAAPDSAGALGAYADWVDRMRIALADGLDSMMQTLTAMMTTSEAPG